jgi:uncharacterized protein (DUF58 family)
MARPSVIRPTRRAFLLGGSAIVLFLIGSNVQAGWLYVLAAGFAGVLATGFLIPPLALRRLQIERGAAAAAEAGTDISTSLHLRSKGFAGAPVWGSDKFLTTTPFFSEAVSKGSSTLSLVVSAPRRGFFNGAPVEVSSGFPFGVAEARRKMFVESPITIHPNTFDLRGFPLLEAVSAPNEAIHDRRRRGSGMEFYGIREYRSGDSIRHIHWASVARTGRLLVREFEDHPSSRLAIFVDASPTVGTEPDTAFEAGASCAASIVSYALTAGHPVQLFTDSRSEARHLFEPSRHEALDWLARVEADGSRGLARLVRDAGAEVQPRSTNVIVFPTTRKASNAALEAAAELQAMNTRVIAVVLSAQSFDSGKRSLSAEEEEELINRLSGGRTVVYRVARGEDLARSLGEPYHPSS